MSNLWETLDLPSLWDNAEKIGNIAQVFIAVLATLALIFAYLQIMSARRAQREATAKDLYRDYLKLAFEHPDLAIPDSNQPLCEKYSWFVAILLNAYDEILFGTNHEVWRSVVRAELRYHVRYLQSDAFLKEEEGWSRNYSPLCGSLTQV